MVRTEERRRNPWRVMSGQPVATFSETERGDGVVANFATGGLYVETNTVYPKGTHVHLQIAHKPVPVVANAKVVHIQYIDDEPVGLGLRLVPWSELMGIDVEGDARAKAMSEASVRRNWPWPRW